MAKQTATIKQMSQQLTPALQQGLEQLPSRLAQATGVQTGMLQAVTGAISSQLVPAEAPALQISDAVQTAIEEALTPAAQVMFGIVEQAMQTIESVLQPLVADYQANQPKTRKRCTSQSPTPGATGPGLGPLPSPPPLGCYWLYPPAGTGEPALLTCQNPYPADPYGTSPATVTPSPPVQQTPLVPTTTRTIYTVYIGCNQDQLIGVPGLTGAIDKALRADGWRQVFPPGTIEAGTPAEAAQMLTALVPSVQRMCMPLSPLPAV